MDLSVADSEADKGAATQKLLKEKENAIQLLKNEVGYPSYSAHIDLWADRNQERKGSLEYITHQLQFHIA